MYLQGVMKGGKVEAIAAPEDSDSDSDSDSDDETTKKIKGAIVEISDAELFKRCGGLTGHKGTVKWIHGPSVTRPRSVLVDGPFLIFEFRSATWTYNEC